jgi:hypothetical protein
VSKLPIKLGFCIAYDWYFLAQSLPLVYKHADLICFSIDKERISWTGQKFPFDQLRFDAFIRQIDTDNKIRIYEDDFHLPSLQPMQNEIRQRNLMAEFMDEGGWHIQLDADEYFLDFERFTKYLQNFNEHTRKLNICCPWITMYKQSGNDYLLVHPRKFRQHEFIQVATRWPHYEYGRRNGYFNILTDFFLLHQSWARSENEIWEKLNNWGHKEDIDINKCFRQWKECNSKNFKSYKNFHHLKPVVWPSLLNVNASTFADLVIKLKTEKHFFISKYDLTLANSIWISRIKSIIGLK